MWAAGAGGWVEALSVIPSTLQHTVSGVRDGSSRMSMFRASAAARPMPSAFVRTLDSGGLIFGTMTPLKGMTWVYNTVYLNEATDPNVWYVTMSWEDNP